MVITLETDLIEALSYRGVLAYVAVTIRGDGRWTTAQLAQTVGCNTSLMYEGMQEIHVAIPETVRKQVDKKWPIGSGIASDERGQILDSEAARRTDFLDDLKRYWDFANPQAPFEMSVSDGRAVHRFLKQHKDWDREMWRKALQNRWRSEVNHSQKLFAWVGRLVEYSATPLDKFGKPMLNGGGKHGEAISREQANNLARQHAVAAAGSHV